MQFSIHGQPSTNVSLYILRLQLVFRKIEILQLWWRTLKTVPRCQSFLLSNTLSNHTSLSYLLPVSALPISVKPVKI